MPEYVKYCNECRLYSSLDIKNHQTSLKAFSDKKIVKAIRKSNHNWKEECVNDGVK